MARRERCRDDRDTGRYERKRAKPEPTAEQRAAEEMVARAREQGLSLTGPDGLLKQLTETLLEIVRPVNLSNLPNPYDECFEEESEHDRSPKAMD